MRHVSVKREAHHRGYRIEGVKQGEGMLLSVFPTRPNLPTLKFSRFRTVRGSWIKAVSVVTGYIDEELKDNPTTFLQKKASPITLSGQAASPTHRPIATA
jgi:hypothetical protein